MRGSDDGFLAAEWAIGVAVLLVPVMLLMAVLPTWSARHEATAAAAREATRVAAAHADGPAAVTVAQQAAREVLRDRTVDPAEGVVVVDLPVGTDGRVPREGTVRARVTLPGATVVLPLLGTVEGPTVTSTHARRLDPHRSRP